MQMAVVILVDMDCFYVQVEKKLHPELRGKPCAVVQYKKWQGGSIIAVDYEAKKYGVSRLIKGDEAKRICPELRLARIPEKRGKADLTNYRKASVDVMAVLSRFSKTIEKASIDEAFLDITAVVEKRISNMEFARVKADNLPSTHLAGYKWEGARGDKNNEQSTPTCKEELEVQSESSDGSTEPVNKTRQDMPCHDDEKERYRLSTLSDWLDNEGNSNELVLTVGAMVTSEIRHTVLNETGFTCSAGIGHNKMLAKLAAGMNKPNQQTILPTSQIPAVFSTIPFKKVRHLGGKLGEKIKEGLKVEFVGEVTKHTLKLLQEKFGMKNGQWLYEVSRGIDYEPVRPRTIVQSIGCGKNFNGFEKLKTSQQVMHWLTELSTEVVERLEEDMRENSRRARTITVSLRIDESASSITRSFPLHHYDVDFVTKGAWSVINRGHCIPGRVDPKESTPLGWTSGICNIHMTAGKFVTGSCGVAAVNTIDSFLQSTSNSVSSITDSQATQHDGECKELNDQCEAAINSEGNETLTEQPSSKLLQDNSDFTDTPISSSKAVSYGIGRFLTPRSTNKTPISKTPLRSSSKGKAKNANVLLTSYFTPLKRERSDSLENISSTANALSPTSTNKKIKNDVEELPLSLADTSLTICTKCGEEILGLNYSSHVDYHYALELQESFNTDEK